MAAVSLRAWNVARSKFEVKCRLLREQSEILCRIEVSVWEIGIRFDAGDDDLSPRDAVSDVFHDDFAPIASLCHVLRLYNRCQG